MIAFLCSAWLTDALAVKAVACGFCIEEDCIVLASIAVSGASSRLIVPDNLVLKAGSASFERGTKEFIQNHACIVGNAPVEMHIQAAVGCEESVEQTERRGQPLEISVQIALPFIAVDQARAVLEVAFGHKGRVYIDEIDLAGKLGQKRGQHCRPFALDQTILPGRGSRWRARRASVNFARIQTRVGSARSFPAERREFFPLPLQFSHRRRITSLPIFELATLIIDGWPADCQAGTRHF